MLATLAVPHLMRVDSARDPSMSGAQVKKLTDMFARPVPEIALGSDIYPNPETITALGGTAEMKNIGYSLAMMVDQMKDVSSVERREEEIVRSVACTWKGAETILASDEFKKRKNAEGIAHECRNLRELAEKAAAAKDVDRACVYNLLVGEYGEEIRSAILPAGRPSQETALLIHGWLVDTIQEDIDMNRFGALNELMEVCRFMGSHHLGSIAMIKTMKLLEISGEELITYEREVGEFLASVQSTIDFMDLARYYKGHIPTAKILSQEIEDDLVKDHPSANYLERIQSTLRVMKERVKEALEEQLRREWLRTHLMVEYGMRRR